MKSKKVVTSFLQFNEKILVMKRSAKVKAHRQMWGGISGYLEKGEEPLTRALIEIQEETGLSNDDVDIITASEPIGIPDKEIDVLWIIYPHLFKTQRKEIKIDCEHTEHKWIQPEALSDLVTVPALNETLQMVLPTPIEKLTSSQEVIEKVKLIEMDKNHGASWLANKAIEVIEQVSNTDNHSNLDDYLNRIKAIAELLMNLRPSMGAINNQVGDLLFKIVEKSKETSNIDEISFFINKEKKNHDRITEENPKLIAKNVLKLIPNNARILTHSYSSAVIESLILAHKSRKNIQIFVSESRPLFEGRITAKELSEHGIPTTLVTDAAAGFFAGNVDMLLFGADSLLSDGEVINKAGTYPIVLAASYQGIPIYIAADIGKLNLRSFFTNILLEEKEISEVWSEGPSNISIRNLYFDVTPKFFITGIITERQKIRPDELIRISREMMNYRYII